jgi:hypothetical protein
VGLVTVVLWDALASGDEGGRNHGHQCDNALCDHVERTAESFGAAARKLLSPFW